MEQRLSLVTLGVDDVARARRFYQALGWTPGFANEEVTFFQLGGIVLSLWNRAAMARDTGRTPRGPGDVALAHNVRTREGVDAALAEAVAAGGTVLRPAHQAEWGGYSGYFADPDGHAWEVAWNPDWRIDDDGNVHLPR
ncbi:VOC family protein [Longimicrobium sp.]|uniref:VOC family protein n=1 Tax=Longimicrobium sp. TaxID=2029185 RepID=UPI002E2F45A5|nr:VOC family protein [Longimicrobium sp.]HEX6038762.1 VOC family protein [Longimicrobium sp.]